MKKSMTMSIPDGAAAIIAEMIVSPEKFDLTKGVHGRVHEEIN